MSRLALFTGLLLAATVTGGCGTSVLPGNDPAVAQDVARLKERVVELQRQAAVSEIELERLRGKVERLEAQLAGRAPAASATTPPASRSVPVQPPRVETPPVERIEPGRVEPARPRETEPILEEIEIEDDELDRPQRPSDTPPPTDARPAPSGAAVTADAQALYDRGYTLYHQGKYLDAETTFQQFVASYGATDLADNALYWIGEARYARGDVRGALAAFRETVQRYPEGNKIPDALLKAAQALEALGDTEGSRETYRELADRFPGSAAAAVAEERLRSMP